MTTPITARRGVAMHRGEEVVTRWHLSRPWKGTQELELVQCPGATFTEVWVGNHFELTVPTGNDVAALAALNITAQD